MSEKILRALVRKWIAQANHPMRQNSPTERDLLLKCARELSAAISETD